MAVRKENTLQGPALEQAQAAALSNPRVQALLQTPEVMKMRGWMDKNPGKPLPVALKSAMGTAIKRAGLQPGDLPNDYAINPDGNLRQNEHTTFKEILPGLIAAGTGGAAAFLLPAAAAAGAGTAATAGGATAAGAGAGATGAGVGAGATAAGTAAGGSILSRVPGWIDAGTRAMGAAADARAEQRAGEQVADTIQGQREAQNITSDLAQRRFLNENRTQATNEAVRGSFLQGVQDANITAPEGMGQFVPSITGGLRPSAIPDRATIGQALYSNALKELEDPMRVASDPAAREGRTLPSLPKVDPAASSGGGALDKILSWGSLAGSVLPFLNSRSRAAAGAPAPAAPALINNQVPNAPAVSPLVSSPANRSLLGRGVRF